MLILGGLVVIALFAALLAPWFINWDDYKGNFQAEAEKILGQPVRVVGSAKASILPSPSLTFTNVEVGDTEGQPMMTVEKFSVTIELMPLLQGEIRVVSMRLERPVVAVSIDDTGLVDWLIRSEASKALDPDKVVLDDVEISGGTLAYKDARTGLDLVFSNINAAIGARSLAGPWRVEGTYQEGGTPVAFQFATGRWLDDGSIRVKTDVTPAQLPLAIAADGVVSGGADGLNYAGTYSVTQIVAATEGGTGDTAGWRSEGAFTLTRDRLVIDRAVLSEGPPDRPSSLAGAMTIDLGKDASFTARAEARQLDLDRSLGEGPTKPIDVGTAAKSLVAWLGGLPVPGIPGRLAFDVPGIVVGGAVIQDVHFDAVPEDGGWQIEGLHARLPGQATIDADGTLSTGERVGFGGAVRLAVGQPATFASWWRGRSEAGSGRLLAPFDLSGRATINLAGIQVEDMETTIGDATIRGSFAWTAAGEGSPLRLLRTNLSADRLDFVQIRALAELLAGQDLGDTTALADSYSIRFVADELAIEDVVMRDVEVDAGFENGDLTVNGIDINDIGGARVTVTRGQIDDILTEPRGRLEAQLNAATLTGLARVIDRLVPDTTFSRWVNRVGPSLAPVALGVVVDSTVVAGKPSSRVEIKGSAAATNFDASLQFAGAPKAWRSAEATVTASLSSYDAFGLARQAGVATTTVEIPGGARFGLSAAGTPDKGMKTTLDGSFGGLALAGAGDLILAAELPPKFDGTFSLESADVDPLIRMTGLTIPGAAIGTSVELAGTLATLGLTADAAWSNADIAGRRVGGKVRISEGTGGSLRFDGTLDADEVDLGWVASLGLGFAPLPTGDPESPWSKTPFGDPALGGLAGKLDVAAETLRIGDSLQIANPALAFVLAPNRIDFDVKSGEFIGGSVVGGLSIRNVGGNASLAGRLSLVGGALDSVVWQRAGRSVAVGTLDLSANFESTGRSPSGLISSLTGGGTLAIHDGEARYVNPRAVSLVIRSSDLGQQFTEDALRDLFGSYIDAGALHFAEVEGPFAVAAGTIRFQSLALDTVDARAVGSAAIDLNTVSIDSDWTLTLDTGEAKDEATPPQVGLVFRGSLADPTRIIDVLQFSSYLNIRQEQRIQEILALEEAARLENDRFKRERRKLKEDADRREREAAALREARAAAVVRVEALHVAREIAAEERATAELDAAHRRAAAAAAAKAAAEAAAAAALEQARQARAAADAAATAAAEKASAYDLAAANAAEATAARVAAETAAAAAAERATSAEAAMEAAAGRSGANADSEAAAGKALKAATAAREQADAAARAAAAVVEAATAAAERAAAEVTAAVDAVAAAEQTAIDRIEAARKAVDAFDLAEAERLAAEARATAAANVEAISAESAGKAESERKAAEAAVRIASTDTEKAAAALVASKAAAKSATADAEKAAAEQTAAEDAARAAVGKADAADAALAEADRNLDAARRRVAEAGSAGPTLDIAAIGFASAVAQAAENEAAAKALDAERLRAEAEKLASLAAARADAAAAAKTVAGDARAAVDEKSRIAGTAATVARKAETDAAVKAASAAAARTAADAAAADAVGARDAAVAAVALAEAAAKGVASRKRDADKAAAAAEAARDAAASAGDKASAARAAADAAAAEKERLDRIAREKADAEAAAASALAAVEAGRDAADAAATAAAEAAKVAREQADAARTAAEKAAQAEAAALAAVDEAAALRDAADRAAGDAAAVADKAETVAKTAAEKAAAMPSAWAIPAADGDGVGTVDRRAEAEPGPALADRPALADALPLVDTPPLDAGGAEDASLAPALMTPPPMPRPKPVKRPSADASPVLPTDIRPLIITPTPLQ